MKYLKKAIILLGILFLLFRLSLFIFRLPSYEIKTTGKLYVVNKLSEDIQAFDLLSGKQTAVIPIDILSHEAVVTSDNSRVVATNTEGKDGNAIKIINVKNARIENSVNLDNSLKVSGIVALPEADKVAVIDLVNDDLLVINVETSAVEKQISTKQKKSHLLVLHPKKPIAYVTNIDSGSISVIDLNLDEVIKIVPCGEGRKGIEITPDGSELWVTNTKDNTITIIDTVSYDIIAVLDCGNESMKLKFTTDGENCFVVNANDGTISIYNQQSKKKIKTINLPGKGSIFERILYHTPRPVNILMHPNGLYAFVVNSNADKIEVIDVKTFSVISTIGTGRVPDALVFVE